MVDESGENRKPGRSPSGRPRLPSWLRTPFQGGRPRREVRALLDELGLHTVCESARCPNLCECWARKAATFMVLGDRCTRNCRFCAVPHGKPQPPAADEPERVAQAVEALGLRYVVVTCVTRDDLADGGAGHVAATVAAIRSRCPGTGTEVLPSDLGGRKIHVATVVAAAPTVFNHNIETVERLTPLVRDRADYRRSLQVLRWAGELAAGRTPLVKSGFMLGLGEAPDEVHELLADLRTAGVQILTIGQYLPPSADHWPLARYVRPGEFAEWRRIGEEEYGFSKVVSGPLVRSSYLAAEAAAAVSRQPH